MNRRGFIGSILALAVAPAIVRADSLMRIVPRDAVLLDDGWEIAYDPVDYGWVDNFGPFLAPASVITRAQLRLLVQNLSNAGSITSTRPCMTYHG